ncbi:hypothetical protein BDP27DRAFT_1431040 [Rhodocollybia butyracea]|uniref:Uncharacterized protein n=1 Tax=Rhodocollybia butyracea TaxID=206335 RepID=A0A9P5P689_9AGAR|nr:hypothetical protein BDP27DRAFT_1431040 [Rhodocollybia butyracea]
MGPRSPPKATSSRERLEPDRSDNNNSNLYPEKWAIHDTTVNVASAIFQATEMNTNNPNSSWASGSRSAALVLAPEQNRLSKSIVPDSEAEESREQSPFSLNQLMNLAQAAIQKTSCFLGRICFVRVWEHEPNGNNSSRRQNTVGPEKRRKKTTRKKGGNANCDGEEHASPFHRASVPRNSVLTPLRRPQSRQGSQVPADSSLDTSHSLNLDTIPENPEIGQSNDNSYSYDDTSLSPMRGLGGKSGSLVFTLFRLFVSGVSSVSHLGGRTLGKAVNFIVAANIVWLWELLVGPTPQFSLPPLPSWSSALQYTSPGIPAENIEQLNARWNVIESMLSTLVMENEQTRAGTANGRRCLQSRPVPTAEAGVEHSGNDEEARAKLAALQEHFGSFKGGIKEALDQEHYLCEQSPPPKKASPSNLPTARTSLITHLVDDSLSLYSKDVLACPEYALHSGGARITLLTHWRQRIRRLLILIFQNHLSPLSSLPHILPPRLLLLQPLPHLDDILLPLHHPPHLHLPAAQSDAWEEAGGDAGVVGGGDGNCVIAEGVSQLNEM